MGRRKKPFSGMDVGGWAEHYASRPLGHHKAEVYRLFVDVLRHLGPDVRILDVGAGPGHFAREYFRCYRSSRARFVLLDSSAELLRIARQQLASRADQVRTVVRDFNEDGWASRLGKFDAIVSNNALFHVWPERLGLFYRACFARLKRNGVLLNQQSFGWAEGVSPYGDDRFSRFMRALPESILPKLPGLSASERRRLAREKHLAEQKYREARAEADATGARFRQERGYQFLSVGRHLECMRQAGFACGCVWRKREFGVLLGVKGEPLSRAG